jgi:cytochrome c oxidase cbb3-type subunit 3
VYNYRCYFCHGYNGDAKTLAASYITPPPRNFMTSELSDLARDYMIEVVTNGKPDTAMQGFSAQIGTEDIAAVVDFVRHQFLQNKAYNTRYHTPENGWYDHQQYADAFPFALEEIALDTPWEELNASQRRGKKLFLESCVICHDRAKVSDEGAIWSSRPLSFPRNGYSHLEPDAVSAASVYAKHDQSPDLAELSELELQGRELYRQNCAFCHANDGTGKNWIGRFIEPHPRDFTDAGKMGGLSVEDLMQRIGDGVEGTAMPAWKTVLDENQLRAVASYVWRLYESSLKERP